MNRSKRFVRILLACLLLAMLAAVPHAIAEEGVEGEVDTNNFTGTYEIGGTTNSGKPFSAVVVIWDNGESAVVRGVVPKVGPMSKSFAVQQTGEDEYLVSGGVRLFVINGSGSATLTKKGDGYEMGGAARGDAFGSEGSVSFGGARVSMATDAEVSTTVGDKTDAASGDKPMTGADSAAQPLTPDSAGELPPVDDVTKAGLIGIISLIIAVQLVMEVIMGGSISKADLKDSIVAGHEAVSDFGSTGSSVADASDCVGDIGQSVDSGGGE